MKEFKIITDSCCDLPISYIKDLNIPFIRLTYRYNNTERVDDLGTSYPLEGFYEDIRNGAIPKTSQPSTQSFCDEFKKILDEGKELIYIGASSGLSGIINNANLAKAMLQEDYPNLRIFIIDILTASLAQGLMVLKSLEMQKQGASIDDIVNYLEENKQKLNSFMTVNDINYLRRGGRISATAAFAGMLLNIKPFLTISNTGKVLPLGKLRGRKRSINALLEKILERIENPEEQTIAISHGDCIEDAEILKELILSKIKVKDIITNYVGPVVGCYGGPGSLNVFFLGKERDLHIEA